MTDRIDPKTLLRHSPHTQQIIFQVLAEFALRGDSLEDLEKQDSQEIFGWDRGSTSLPVHLIKRGRHTPQGPVPVGYAPCEPQRWPSEIPLPGRRQTETLLVRPRLPGITTLPFATIGRVNTINRQHYPTAGRPISGAVGHSAAR